MKIHHAGVGLPSIGYLRDSLVIQRLFAPPPFGEPVPGADVIPGEHIEWLRTAEQDVFGRPSSASFECRGILALDVLLRPKPILLR